MQNVHERAAQIWPVLVLAAHHRQTVSYTMLARATGIDLRGLGKCLAPIQSYCLLHKLPALTSLVVRDTGRPGDGFIAEGDIPTAQAKVFARSWLDGKTKAPTPDQFEDAATRLPSNGRPEAVAEAAAV